MKKWRPRRCFNDLVEPNVDGSQLTIDGLRPGFVLKPHQLKVVQRAVTVGGNLLIAHGVGAGKTAEMAAIAMKLKQLGVLRKPMFVVPKSVAAQWGREFISYFPNARLLVPGEADYQAANRKTLVSRIASNEYDAVILSYEIFEGIPLSAPFMSGFYQKQISELMAALQEAKLESKDDDRKGRRSTVKEIEKAMEALNLRLQKVEALNRRDVDVVEFEQMGIDGLFVDEAHNFKTLRVNTKMTNVSGINTSSDSGRAFDLMAKVDYMRKLNGGRGVYFATATPVMNPSGRYHPDAKRLYAQPIFSEQMDKQLHERAYNHLQHANGHCPQLPG